MARGSYRHNIASADGRVARTNCFALSICFIVRPPSWAASEIKTSARDDFETFNDRAPWLAGGELWRNHTGRVNSHKFYKILFVVTLET